MSKKKVHEGVLLAPCAKYDEIHEIDVELEHGEDEPCPIGFL